MKKIISLSLLAVLLPTAVFATRGVPHKQTGENNQPININKILGVSVEKPFKPVTMINYSNGTKVVASDKQNADRLFSLGYSLFTGDKLGFNVVTNYKKNLSTPITSTQSTIPVTSMNTVDGHTITMSDLGSQVFLTLEPGGVSEELIVCTGISTLTWTGCTRGLAYYGTSLSAVAGNKKTHQSGSIVIMSNVQYVYKQFVDKDTAETVGGQKTFTSSPIIPTPGTSDSTYAANVNYVNNVAIQGAATSTEYNMGIVQLGTAAQVAAGTASSSAGAPLVIPAKIATSSNDVAGTHLPMTQSNGTIKSNQIDQTANYTLTGTNTFATTTVASSTIGYLNLTNQANTNQWPTASTSVVSKGYSDSLATKLNAYSHTQTSVSAASAGTTYVVYYNGNLGTLGPNDTTTIRTALTNDSGSGNVTWAFNLGDGTATSTITWAKSADYDNLTFVEIKIAGRNSTSSQVITYTLFDTSGTILNNWATSTLNTTNPLRFSSTFLNSAQNSRTVTQEYFDAYTLKP